MNKSNAEGNLNIKMRKLHQKPETNLYKRVVLIDCMFDVICVGNATRDVFVHLRKPHKARNGTICLKEGSKQEVDGIKYDTGGGAVNSAVAFSRLGLKTGILAAVGKDESGKKILEELRKEKVSTALVKQLNCKTAYSAIVTGEGFDRIILTYGGATRHLTNNRQVDWKKMKAKWLHVSSFHSKPNLLREIFSFAKQQGIKIAFNPGRSELGLGLKKLSQFLRKSDVLFLNRTEAEMLVGKNSIKSMLEKLQLFSETVVITDGKKGVHGFDGEKYYFKKTYCIKEVDTTGAGDAFNSGFIAALITGTDLDRAMAWGMEESQSIIEHLGAKEKLLSKSSLEKFIKKHEK